MKAGISTLVYDVIEFSDETMSGNIPGKDMNGVEKGMEFSREAWEKELSKFYVCRSDMNKLIMNYLITG